MYNDIFHKSCKLDGLKCDSILDVATGRGYFLDAVLKNITDISCAVGCDTSNKYLNIARENLSDKRVIFIQADAKKLPFLDAQFDLVTISNSLHHFDDIQKVVEESVRVTKLGGLFVINELVTDNLSEAQTLHLELNNFFITVDKILGYYHDYTYSIDEIKSFIGTSSVHIVEQFVYEGVQMNIDINEKDRINRICKAIDDKLEEIRDFPPYNELKKSTSLLKSKIKQRGLRTQNQLVLICRKLK